MNRRKFCFEIAASAACIATTKGIAECAPAISSAAAPDASDPYPIWSFLVPILQCQCPSLRGFLIAQRSAVPDHLPYVSSSTPGTPIEKAHNAMEHPYGVEVPHDWQERFDEAIADANQRKTDSTMLQRHFALSKRYRLISEDQIHEFHGLTPQVAPADWKPDEKLAKSYDGWGDCISLSLPFFDARYDLAMVWAATSGSGCSDSAWHYFTRQQEHWVYAKWKSMRREECA